MGVKLGPLVLGTLLKHYLERHNVTRDSKARNELLFDEAFIIVKAFMEESTKHTVEELQQFSNARIPSPPWVHCVRVLIPLECCDAAAPLLLQALGGPEAVGGSRGVRGVDAQWVAVKRDWRDAEKRRKQRQDPMSPVTSPTNPPSRFNSMRFRRTSVPELRRSRTAAGTSTSANANANTNTGAGRGRSNRRQRRRREKRETTSSAHGRRKRRRACPAQETCYQRREDTSYGSAVSTSPKMTLDSSPAERATPGSTPSHTPRGHGTENLAPSPVPGASQHPKSASAPKFSDPAQGEEEAHYEPRWTICDVCCTFTEGDIILDQSTNNGSVSSGTHEKWAVEFLQPPPGAEHLPVPPNMVIIAGHHPTLRSFPAQAIHTLATPSDELTAELRGRMTRKVREVVKRGKSKLGLGPNQRFRNRLGQAGGGGSRKADETKRAAHHHTILNGAGGKRTRATRAPRVIWMLRLVWVWVWGKGNGDATGARGNSVLAPPPGATLTPTLKKPELPDMTAEPASALPEEIPLPVSRATTPDPPHREKVPKRQPTVDPSKGPIEIEIDGQMRTVKSQIQFYAHAHKAANPEKYPVKPETKEFLALVEGYREQGIALFCKHVTGPKPRSGYTYLPPTPVIPEATIARSPELEPTFLGTESNKPRSPLYPPSAHHPARAVDRRSLLPCLYHFRRLCFDVTLLDGVLHPLMPRRRPHPTRPLLQGHPLNDPQPESGPLDPSVYKLQAMGTSGFESPFKNNMIRERVSTAGVLRPLEPESKLDACKVPLEAIGVINAAAVKRYLEGQALWDAKFSGTLKSIAKTRLKNLELARKEGRKSMGALAGGLANGTLKDGEGGKEEADGSPSSSVTFLGSSNWSMSWALEGENPPPSSIVSRRDTAEARQLAICADRDLSNEETKMSGNNLWNIVISVPESRQECKVSDPLAADQDLLAGDSSLGFMSSLQPPRLPFLLPCQPPPSISKRMSSGS
ncbi:Alpha beta-hydrolase [Rhizoctonia solani]|uniref:Alpha beta-hydrolase n=1 Tax=Rhizoctonia solani TaxID=456999 RepID=A0A8H7IH16_9AGAM|nr:Alpha beta-hydrolase [Rhizoctonia solani]